MVSCDNTADDPSTSDKNLMNFGPVIHEFAGRAGYTLGFATHFWLFMLDLSGAGVEYLRSHGITHRDIKPSNILCHKLEDGR